MQLRTVAFWKLAATGAALGALALGLWAATRPIRYVSKSTLAISATPLQASEILNHALNKALSKDQLSAIISQRKLYPGSSSATPEVISAMRREIQIGLTGGNSPTQSAFVISFRHPDPHAASSVNSDLISSFARVLASQAGPDGKSLSLLVLDPPSSPERPINQPLSAMLAMGSVLGAFLAALAYGVIKLVSTLSRRVASQ